MQQLEPGRLLRKNPHLCGTPYSSRSAFLSIVSLTQENSQVFQKVENREKYHLESLGQALCLRYLLYITRTLWAGAAHRQAQGREAARPRWLPSWGAEGSSRRGRVQPAGKLGLGRAPLTLGLGDLTCRDPAVFLPPPPRAFRNAPFLVVSGFIAKFSSISSSQNSKRGKTQ